MSPISTPPLDRFFDKLILGEDNCWLWAGAITKGERRGYAQLSMHGRPIAAHRFAYEHFREAIPEGLTLDHLCRVRHCVNPWHLEAVTIRENTLRGDTFAAANASKTHCVNGHEFTPENTRWSKTKNQPRKRVCRTCAREWMRAKRTMTRL